MGGSGIVSEKLMYSGKNGKVEPLKIGLKFLNLSPNGSIVEMLAIGGLHMTSSKHDYAN